MEEIPYALLNWIKKDQEERRQHALKMSKKNFKEDEEFMRLISALTREWNKLKTSDKLFINSLSKQRAQNRCFTPAQRSAVTAMYLRYCC